jgi:hypothetical protein
VPVTEGDVLGIVAGGAGRARRAAVQERLNAEFGPLLAQARPLRRLQLRLEMWRRSLSADLNQPVESDYRLY